MSTIFRLRRKDNNDDESSGSGGKIMRGRRVPDVRSPYARPPANQTAGSPNRLLGLISPASRMITGAAKMISTVFFPDSPQTSSSEDESDDDDDIASEEDGRLNQNGAISEADTHTEENLQLNISKKEIKLAIEHLVVQETFSSAECNRLVKIIESRVVDLPAITSQSAAVMEARKWLEEKKMESNSQLDKNQGTFGSNPYMLTNITDGEQGSPVIMAKSYMKSRPPWASPTIGQFGFKTSPIGMSTSVEEAHSLSSSKDLKRNSHAIDSLTDGSKRVRFKSADHTAQPLPVHDDPHKDLGAPTTVADDVFLDSHDGPPDQSADMVSSEVRQTTSEVNPARQSDSNDLPRVNGTNELGMGSSQRHQHFAPLETNSFDESRKADGGKQREITANNGSRVNTMEGSCELLSEASIDDIPSNPSNEEISNVASGSLNSSSRQAAAKETQSISSPGAKRRVTAARGVEKEKEKPAAVVKKVGRYARRGRGRGKLT
ncbi:hypothetical protein ACHQM5_030116 [Ranunculus cassubicifolius]